jgi:hypothetical protein
MAMTTMAADSGISHCSFLGHENGHAQRPFELPSPRAYVAVHCCGDACAGGGGGGERKMREYVEENGSRWPAYKGSDHWMLARRTKCRH